MLPTLMAIIFVIFAATITLTIVFPLISIIMELLGGVLLVVGGALMYVFEENPFLRWLAMAILAFIAYKLLFG